MGEELAGESAGESAGELSVRENHFETDSQAFALASASVICNVTADTSGGRCIWSTRLTDRVSSPADILVS